ncbi:transient receptor potential cation channel protein painless-like [Onthophagus taurus]|uniref:transient receptor potential cation channel protein painless-like n=1 Tax=Onthophagus taurus TaxID=166361 RepID=UPI000C1FE16B|nr:transient receptor potential cation channel protein painless-like [Onthophagus taurus]
MLYLNESVEMERLIHSSNTQDQSGDTPIEIAARNRDTETFKRLFQQNSTNNPPFTKVELEKLFKILTDDKIRNQDCLHFLLNQSCLPIDMVNSKGYTPLHIAIQIVDHDAVINLLERRASLANKAGKMDLMPIHNIYPKLLEKHLDDCIVYKDLLDECDEAGMVIEFNYTSFLSDEDSKKREPFSEMDVISVISETPELQYLLSHPIISGFLYNKWRRLLWFFIVNIVFHFVFVAFLVVHITMSNSIYYYGLAFTLGVLILKEAIQIIFSPTSYITDFENYIEISMIISTVITLCNEHGHVSSAVAILLTSIQTMFYIGKHPALSIYVSFLKTVSLNFFKFILWSSILLVGFTLSFFIIYNKPIDNNINGNYTNNTNIEESDFYASRTLTFTKIILMLVGELDANPSYLQTLFNQIIFLFFIFFMTITLSNVINGLAVHDIQTTESKAEINSLIERTRRIIYIERFLLDNRVRCLLNCFNIHELICKEIFLFYDIFKNKTIEFTFYNALIAHKPPEELFAYIMLKVKNLFKTITCWRALEKKSTNNANKIVLERLISKKKSFDQCITNIKRNVDKFVEELKNNSIPPLEFEHINIVNDLNTLEKYLN